MPYLCSSICHPFERLPGSLLKTSEGQQIEAATLGEALHVAEQMFQASIVPHDPPKWFRVKWMEGTEQRGRLVDIHISRNGEEICPKQDLSFALEKSDIVMIATLIC